MISFSHITTRAKNVVHLSGRTGKQMIVNVCSAVSQSPSSSFSFYFRAGNSQSRFAGVTIDKSFCSQAFRQSCLGYAFSKRRRNRQSLTITRLVSSTGQQVTCLGISLPYQNMSLRLSVPKQEMHTKVRWNVESTSWLHGGASASLIFGLLVCFSSSNPVYSELGMGEKDKKDVNESPFISSSHGKKVYNNYSITGIPGDGRCLFRSVAHGACLRSGESSPNESLQRELADNLRAKVADEFIKRREETEWFVEGDFDTYVSQMRKPHVWGGEPELFMASHVLQMPITVYMYDEHAGGLIVIAEYGQEYGKEDPIRVLYHGFGHYDALQIPGKGGRSRS